MTWKEEKEQKRQERELKRHMRVMATPVSRGESLNVMMGLQEQVVSLALAVEALDTLLVEKGVLKDNEVLDRMKVIAAAKQQQMEAASVESESPRIIAPA